MVWQQWERYKVNTISMTLTPTKDFSPKRPPIFYPFFYGVDNLQIYLQLFQR